MLLASAGIASAQPAGGNLFQKPRVLIQPQCLLGDAGTDRVVYVYTAFDMAYEHSTPKDKLKYLKQAFKEKRGRVLWSVECSLLTSDCRGFEVDLTPSDFGEPIKSSDVHTMQGARIASHTDSFFVIEWGSYVLTVDLKTRRLTMRFDTSAIAGRGVGACDSQIGGARFRGKNQDRREQGSQC